MTDQPDSWLRTELRAKLTEIADLQMRLKATERHTADLNDLLHQVRQELAETRRDLADANTNRDEAAARLQQAEADLREASHITGLLPAVEGPVWRP